MYVSITSVVEFQQDGSSGNGSRQVSLKNNCLIGLSHTLKQFIQKVHTSFSCVMSEKYISASRTCYDMHIPKSLYFTLQVCI